MKQRLGRFFGLGVASAEVMPERTSPKDELNRTIRLGVLFLAAGFGGFLLWAAMAPLDEGVPAPGVVSVDSKRKAIQHLQGGVVGEILVRDGDLVAKDQPLLKLDSTPIESRVATVRNNYWQMLATYGRLQSEQARLSEPVFDARLLKDAEMQPKAKEAVALQRQLFISRKKSLENQKGIYAQSAASAQEQVRGLKALSESRARQIELLEKDVAGLRDLVSEGYAPRSRLLELERMLAQLNGERSTTIADIDRANRAIAEAQLRSLQSEQDFLKDVDSQMSQVQTELNRWSNELQSAEEELARVTLKSPIAGRIVGLNQHTVGGVVKPGETLMEVVPENDLLVVDIQIPPHLIDKVHPGLPAEVRFSSLGTRGQVPIIMGKLKTISADRLTDQRGMAFYVGTVHVDKQSLAELARLNLKVLPGMPAEVVVKTGERTMLDYLLRPLLNHLAPALTEH
ncbi:HlyD family type I secretion periplasmic adaptor subunit [Chitinilyticum piscinae]|uniref:Membrane fusion protein (MFP) family protein n=1 Tax=Chitinilyticum piscinae TaxID=2866724 RepID=A0A8J7G227_9NEIS|nr:HlyD family type I secretion periplasmic adaptor subunit [Chitinilyticum piscinae]MBE9610550.1 HlyD family type I secretion periplasmic adaptor subunit [Chitinilyticum piscinae]